MFISQPQSSIDYWLYCVTNSVEPRLFVDFNANSCVIVRDRARFTRMLDEATRLQLSGAAMQDDTAVYVDPLLPTSANILVPFMKHFRYAYQDEHRFCWLPPAPIQKLTLCGRTDRGYGGLCRTQANALRINQLLDSIQITQEKSVQINISVVRVLSFFLQRIFKL